MKGRLLLAAIGATSIPASANVSPGKLGEDKGMKDLINEMDGYITQRANSSLRLQINLLGSFCKKMRERCAEEIKLRYVHAAVSKTPQHMKHLPDTVILKREVLA